MATVAALAAAGAVLLLPGLALVCVLRLERDAPIAVAIAIGLSIAVWPLLFLWSSLADAAWSTGVVWSLLAASAAAALVAVARSIRSIGSTNPRNGRTRMFAGGLDGHAATLGLIVAVAVAVRVAQAHGLVVPPWVDGLHHTEITARFLESAGLPSTLRPYLPLDRFYYHFGFHALAAVSAWVGQVTPQLAVLWMGQLLSALACVTVYALARETGVRKDAALLAAAVPATLYWFPMYFLTWSRFTQLCGLVLLPIAWVLFARALQSPGVRAIGVASVAAAGLVLVHYRVAVFFGLGVAVLVAAALLSEGRNTQGPSRAASTARWRPVAVALTIAAVAIGLAAPWLIHQLRVGVIDMSAAGREAAAAGGPPTWYSAGEDGLEVPPWLFTQRGNTVWLAAALAGFVVGGIRRSAGALCGLGTLVLVALAVRPDVLGLGHNWLLPGFSVAISLFLPAGVGLAYLANEGARTGRALGGSSRFLKRTLRATALAATCFGGLATTGSAIGWPPTLALAWPLRAVDVILPATVIARPADVAAAQWIAAHTPSTARFLVSAQWWHLGSYRGIDGGYWLPVLAHRDTTMPGGLYGFAEPDVVRAISSVSERVSRGDALSDEELSALLDETGAEYLYVGPGGAGEVGKLTVEGLNRRPFLHQVYAEDGAVVFKRLEQP